MTEPETKPLGADFPPATHQAWRKLVDAMLKGAPFERLEHTTYDGLIIEPLYERAADGQVVGGRAPGAAWTLMQRVDHPDPAAANAQALDDLHNGATGLLLVCAGSLSANSFGLDPSATTFSRALDGVQFDAGIVIDIDLPAFAREAPQRLAEVIRARVNPAKADVRFGYDPLTAIAMSGKLPLPWSETAPLMARLIRALADAGFKGPFAVGDGRVVHDAGGSEAQELAFAIASAVAYLRALEAGGFTLDAARDAIYFRLAADADQFLTMAKFRALRKLWARVEVACRLSAKPAWLAAETAWRIMARRDPHVNILRATIAMFAAALGGADAITVLPFTAACGLPDRSARRIARNTQLILGEEAQLARVADSAAGSGATEDLTEKLCYAAWALFQEIEAAGGVAAALASGLIQGKIAAVYEKRMAALARRRDALTGVSIFPNLQEAEASVAARTPAMPQAPAGGATSGGIAVLRPIRLAQPFERLREASDRLLAATGRRPKVFLATLGPQAQFGARATFAKNFFAAGGIETVDDGGDRSALTYAYKASGTALACLSSSDKVYETEAAAAAQALKAAGARHIYLAGRPGEREAQWRAAGVQSFIYEGCDALATLNGAYDILGIQIG
jgi:methylmalonyl-CoA mutase